MLLRNLSFGAKIATSFAIVLTLTLAVGIVGYRALGNATAASSFYHNISETKDVFTEARDHISSYLNYSYPEGRNFQPDLYASAITELEKCKRRIEVTPRDDADSRLAELLHESSKDIATYLTKFEQFNRIETEMGSLESQLRSMAEKIAAQFRYDNRFVSRKAINASKLLFEATNRYLQRRSDLGYRSVDDFIQKQQTELGYWAVMVEASGSIEGSEPLREGVASKGEQTVIPVGTKKVEAVTELSRVFHQRMRAYREQDLKGASILMEMKVGQERLHQNLSRLRRLTQTKMRHTEGTTKITIAVGLAVALLVSFLVALVMTKDIVGPIKRLVGEVQIIASGNLDQSISSDRRDEIGRLVRSVDSMRAGLKTNIEEIRATEKALRESEEYLKTAVDAGNVGLWDWDIKSGRAIFSSVWKRQLGFQEDEIGQRYEEWESRLHPDDLSGTLDALNVSLAPPWPTYAVEFRLRHKDGSYRWILAAGAIEFDENHQPQRMLGAHIDNTERKLVENEKLRLESQLAQAQKMESIGVLAGGIAHDFNNLLMGILGYGNLAIDDLPQDHPAHRKVRAMEQAAGQAAELTQQLLAYSGQGQFVVSEIDASKLVEEIASLLRTTVPKTIRLQKNLDRSLPLIQADPAQLQQVVMNLITNAAEAIGKNSGLVTLSTGQMECSADYLAESIVIPVSEKEIPQPGAYVYFEVQDTGKGIDEETKSRIFEPFFTTKTTGRGLGMAALLGIMRSHRGTIMLDTALGKGSLFRVLFPILHGKAIASAEPEPPSKMARKTEELLGPILVIDDEELVREVCKEILQSQGLEVLCAEDGLRGVEVFRQQGDKISSVILDLSMPNMRGEDCFKELIALDSTIPVILSSGYSEGEISDRFPEKRPADFIKKPYRAASLVEKVFQVSRRA